MARYSVSLVALPQFSYVPGSRMGCQEALLVQPSWN
jgi:hypothetical protein